MTAILTVTSKNQVTFPTELLVHLKVSKGDRLLFRVKGKSLEIEKMETGLRNLQGVLTLSAVGKKKSLEEVIRRAEEKEARRIMNES